MKSFLIGVFCLASGIACAQDLNEGLIVYYPLDGNCHDTSVNQFHGITNAEFTTDHNGNPNKALHFNGFDQYMDFPPNRPELKPPLPISFAFWVKFDTNISPMGVVFTNDFDQNNASGVWVNLSSTMAIGLNYGDAMDNIGPDYRRTKIGQTTIQADTWYYVIGIIRGPEDMDIYLNCMNDGGSYAGYGGELGYTDCQGSFGRKDANMVGPPYYFKGSIDEFRYWNRALTPENIDSLCMVMGTFENPTNETNQVILFPNPVCDDYITIGNIPSQAVRMEIVNADGAMVYSTRPTSKVDLSTLRAGVYFLRLRDEENKVISVSKFIKN
jgi:hypothetical protein